MQVLELKDSNSDSPSVGVHLLNKIWLKNLKSLVGQIRAIIIIKNKTDEVDTESFNLNC